MNERPQYSTFMSMYSADRGARWFFQQYYDFEEISSRAIGESWVPRMILLCC